MQCQFSPMTFHMMACEHNIMCLCMCIYVYMYVFVLFSSSYDYFYFYFIFILFQNVVTVIQPTFCIVIVMVANPSMNDHY